LGGGYEVVLLKTPEEFVARKEDEEMKMKERI